MPADFFIDARQGMVFSKAVAVLSRDDVLDHMDRLLAHPEFKPEHNQLFDFRDVLKPMFTHEDVVLLAQRTIFSPTSKRAFVATADWQFGYGRMFATLRDARGEPGIMAFKDMGQALTWLNLSAEPDPIMFVNLPKPEKGA